MIQLLQVAERIAQIRKALPLLQSVAAGRPCNSKLLRAMRQLNKAQSGPAEPVAALKREVSAASGAASETSNVRILFFTAERLAALVRTRNAHATLCMLVHRLPSMAYVSAGAFQRWQSLLLQHGLVATELCH